MQQHAATTFALAEAEKSAYRGISVLKSTPLPARKKLSDIWLEMKNDLEMKDRVAKSGFELPNVGPKQMDTSMKEKTRLHTKGGRCLALARNRYRIDAVSAALSFLEPDPAFLRNLLVPRPLRCQK